MKIGPLVLGGLSATVIALAGLGAASAADGFPERTIRIIVPTAPGGTLDLTTRLYAEKMGENLGQSIIVENRPGGNTLPGTIAVKDSEPDGYTLVAQAPGLLLVPQMRFDPPFDPLKEFEGIGSMAQFPFILVVGADQPDQNVADLVARAKADPGGLSYASAGVASPPDLAAMRFLRTVEAEMLHAPYKGNGAALPDVAAGRVDMIFDGYVSSASYLQGDKLKALAVGTPERIAPLPDVPTFIEQGIDFTAVSWLALFAPGGTPPEVINRLSEALHFASNDPELAARLEADGSEPVIESPAEFEAFMASEYTRLGDLIEDFQIPKE